MHFGSGLGLPQSIGYSTSVQYVNDTNANHSLSYASGTGTNELVFSLTIAAGNAATDADDVLSIGANAIALNSGTIKDAGTSDNATITNAASIGTAAGTITVTA